MTNTNSSILVFSLLEFNNHKTQEKLRALSKLKRQLGTNLEESHQSSIATWSVSLTPNTLFFLSFQIGQ